MGSALFIDQFHVNVGYRTADVHCSDFKRWRGQKDLRIIGEPKTLFGNTEETSIQFVVFILIVQDNHSVLSGWHFEREQRVISHDREALVREGLVLSFRPAVRRFEKRGARGSFFVAKSGGVNAKRAQCWRGGRSEASTGEHKDGC
jgi:hypothetical protein